jgi:hypothetical protein
VRAEVNQLAGVESRVIWPEEITRMVPAMDCSARPRYPVLAALYHAPGGIVRHDHDPRLFAIKPFSITRFAEDRLVGEKAAAAVSH